jgi:hypothetical protein
VDGSHTSWKILRGNRITFGTTWMGGWMLGKSDWQRKMLGKMWVSIFQLEKKGGETTN